MGAEGRGAENLGSRIRTEGRGSRNTNTFYPFINCQGYYVRSYEDKFGRRGN